MLGNSDKEIVGEYKFNKLFNIPNNKETINEYARIKKFAKTELPRINNMSCIELIDDLSRFISFSLNPETITESAFRYENIRASHTYELFLQKCKNYEFQKN